jgi:hypothetical protein
MDDGDVFEATVSGYQVLEAMAKLTQMQFDGRSGGQAFVQECCDAFALEYNFPMLYLLQEGITDNSTWERDILAVLMCCFQIALMMTPDLVRPYATPSSKRLDPGRVLLYLLDSGSSLMMLYSMLFFKAGAPPDWKKLCDQFCDVVGTPRYTDLLDAEIDAAKYELARVTDPEVAQRARAHSPQAEMAIKLGLSSAEPSLPLGHLRRRTVELGINMLELVRSNPAYIITPLQMISDHNLPMPPIQRENGELTVLPKDEKVWEMSLLPGVFAVGHLLNRIMYTTDLSCYSSPDGNDIVFPCADFSECRSRARLDHISHCTNKLWRELVDKAPKTFGIDKISAQMNRAT